MIKVFDELKFEYNCKPRCRTRKLLAQRECNFIVPKFHDYNNASHFTQNSVKMT